MFEHCATSSPSCRVSTQALPKAHGISELLSPQAEKPPRVGFGQYAHAANLGQAPSRLAIASKTERAEILGINWRGYFQRT